MTKSGYFTSAASDIHVLLVEEAAETRNRNLALELFTVPRVRRATLASGIGTCGSFGVSGIRI